MNKKQILLVAALALGGCATEPIPNVVQLQGPTWQLQNATGDTFTLQIVEGKVVGNGGCNRYFGGITQLSDDLLTLGAIGSTRMMCVDDLAGKESEYLQKLQQVATYTIAGKQLTLSDANKAVLLTYNVVAVPVTK